VSYLALLSPRVWLELVIIAVIGAAAWYGYNWVYDRGAASVQVRWDAERAQVDAQTAELRAGVAAATNFLAQEKGNLRREKDAKITDLNTQLAAALVGLHDRPPRDSEGNVPRDPTTGAALGATGASLLRQDAELLTREAGRADRLRLDLIECQASYDKARQALR
jgi:hypothetical protein